MKRYLAIILIGLVGLLAPGQTLALIAIHVRNHLFDDFSLGN